MKKLIFTICLLLGVVFFAYAEENITIVTEEVRPFNYLENGKLTGVSTEVVQAVLKKIGLDIKIEVYPWARAYKMALEEENVLIFTISRLEQRETLFKWVGVIAASKVWFHKLRARKDITINSLEDAKKYKIAATRQTAPLQYLQSKGINVKDITYENHQNISLLARNRAEIVCLDELVFTSMAKSLGYNPALFEKVYFVKELSKDLYMAFSKKTPDSLVEKFRKGLEDVKADGTYDKVMKKYLQ